MRKNATTVLRGSKCVLVPYEKEHVEVYHGWMQDEYNLAMTASEPLSLEEEFDMQKTWREDENKCTFIVLDNSLESEILLPINEGAMAGDVNVIFSDFLEPGDAEVDIMIAEKRSQRKGIASEALVLLMNYGRQALGVKRFVAKIHASNEPSIALFRSLEFECESFSEAFQEHTFVRSA